LRQEGDGEEEEQLPLSIRSPCGKKIGGYGKNKGTLGGGLLGEMNRPHYFEIVVGTAIGDF